jgi:formylglycine-generating enzyme required for sulfatase activity
MGADGAPSDGAPADSAPKDGASSDSAVAEAGPKDASVDAGDGSTCTPYTQRCSAASILTCSAAGQLGNAWACTTGTCGNSACTGSTTTAPSCTAGGTSLTTCGTQSESCCTSLEVPGGTFYRTYTSDGATVSGQADPATISGFRLDKYLVTVGRFRQFVTAWSGGFRPIAGAGRHRHLNAQGGLKDTTSGNENGWDTGWESNVTVTDAKLNCTTSGTGYATWTTSAGSNEKLPMNCINWWEAYAFCIWDGGFLPSEAEWEYAAAGGSDQRLYPWGAADPGTANQYAIFDCNYPASGGGTCSGFANMTAVGSLPNGAGRWGHLDLSGELWEWVLDWSATYANPCVDCSDSSTGTTRQMRGGSFHNPVGLILPTYRYDWPPNLRDNSVGVRCARVP